MTCLEGSVMAGLWSDVAHYCLVEGWIVAEDLKKVCLWLVAAEGSRESDLLLVAVDCSRESDLWLAVDARCTS